MNKIKLYVITKTDSPLWVFWKQFENNECFVKDINVSLVSITNDHEKDMWCKTKRDINVHHDDYIVLILTDSLFIQKRSVVFKFLRKYPILILRWWDEPAYVKDNIINKTLYNKNIAANLYLSRALEKINSATTKEFLKIENPVHLDQAHLWGEDGKYKMLRHLLDGLTKPNRTDSLGNSKRNYGHIRLTVATHFYCNQNNINTVTHLLDRYAKYSKDVLDRIQFIVIDDGSPIEYDIPKYDLNLTWIRIDEDIHWNHAGARNLALLYSRSNNVIISDVDHHFPESTLSWLSQRDIRHHHFYKFYCKDIHGVTGKGHPNIFYLSRARYFELGGLDEEYCGSWGCEDVGFVKNYKYHGTVQRYLPKKYYCEVSPVDRDKSYHSLFRDQSFNIGAHARKRMEGDYYGKNYGHSRMLLNFKWTIVADYFLDPPIPIINKKWKRLWLFRQTKSLLTWY